jgi:hypothetical protein
MEESIVVVGYFEHQVYTFGLACAFALSSNYAVQFTPLLIIYRYISFDCLNAFADHMISFG